MDPTNLAPHTKSEIIAATEDVWRSISTYLSSLTQDQFHLRPEPQLWSAAENLEHLFMSTKPLVKALGAPKLFLKTFGRPNRPGRTYLQVRDRYQEKLSSIGGGRQVDQKEYGPVVTEESLISEHQEKWESIGRKYPQRIDSWSEKDLDAYLLPHPLLGKLMLREMLFFTVHHSYHHFGLMQDRTGIKAGGH